MNVYENIGLRARKVRQPEIERRVEQAAAMLDITPLLGSLPRQLSGGQRQRVAIGRAIVRDARLFCSTSRSPTSTRNCAMRCAAS